MIYYILYVVFQLIITVALFFFRSFIFTFQSIVGSLIYYIAFAMLCHWSKHPFMCVTFNDNLCIQIEHLLIEHPLKKKRREK